MENIHEASKSKNKFSGFHDGCCLTIYFNNKHFMYRPL
jgi:SPX domain protein involved in polyphosphate accumulation